MTSNPHTAHELTVTYDGTKRDLLRQLLRVAEQHGLTAGISTMYNSGRGVVAVSGWTVDPRTDKEREG